VYRKSRKADLLAAGQNKKVKGEFEIIDHSDDQMEYIIDEAHKIADMSMHVKMFVAKKNSYLLDNDNTNETTIEVDGDNNDKIQLKDYLLIHSFFFSSFPSSQNILCLCWLFFAERWCSICYFCGESFVSPTICDLQYDHVLLQCSKNCGELLCPNCITT
jgi:hypothetical protein